MIYITNGFSIKMLRNPANTIKFKEITRKEFDKLKAYAKNFTNHHMLVENGDTCLCVFKNYENTKNKNKKFMRIDILPLKNIIKKR